MRAAFALNSKGHSLVLWSNRLSVVMNARKFGHRASLLCGFKKEKNYQMSLSLDMANDSENALLPSGKSLKLTQRTVYKVHRLLELEKPDYLWFWNGVNQISQSIIQAVYTTKVKFIFFEIGNFPGKMFVDPEGTNCRSWYAGNKKRLRNWEVDREEFEFWLKNYIESKEKSHIVPQAKIVDKFNFNYFYDLLGFWFLGAITFERLKPFWRTIDYLKRKFFKITFDDFDYKSDGRFIFFPLQVSTDSQLLWNSDISQEDALVKASEMAKKEGLPLIVKPHPAEPHWSALKKVLKIKEKYGFKLVNINPFTLLKHCDRVITINSTVGLEGLLLNKPVEILGNAIYSDFDRIDIVVYIQKYLLDMDYFAKTPLTDNDVNAIFQRGNLNNVCF